MKKRQAKSRAKKVSIEHSSEDSTAESLSLSGNSSVHKKKASPGVDLPHWR